MHARHCATDRGRLLLVSVQLKLKKLTRNGKSYMEVNRHQAPTWLASSVLLKPGTFIELCSIYSGDVGTRTRLPLYYYLHIPLHPSYSHVPTPQISALNIRSRIPTYAISPKGIAPSGAGAEIPLPNRPVIAGTPMAPPGSTGEAQEVDSYFVVL